MVRRIEKDHGRFRQIVRGSIKRDLRKFISSEDLLGRVGKDFVKIPIPQIDLPRFTFHSGEEDGVGQGEGDVGDSADGDQQAPPSEAGDAEGQHTLEVEVPLEELAQILGEELKLPRIKPKGQADIQSNKDRYTGIRRVGPESLRHFKRTFREALKRQVSMGTYDPDHPVIIPIREDRRYRSFSVRRVPESKAVLIYMMDVSGSMGTEQKELVRTEAFWINTWLKSQYKNLTTVYIVHDAGAREVQEHEFFHLRESGGTKISAAYELCWKVIEERFMGDEWNIYPFHFSDGDNWSGRDTTTCIELLRERILKKSNQFSYGQVKSAYGSGQFKRDLDQAFTEEDHVVTSGIQDRDGILDSIRDFLGKGR
ncbi:MAG TPA: DUF444 family protein [Planctomycetota bacterium]|nr:DUF444 family protein [Planctomycetota bacterium]